MVSISTQVDDGYLVLKVISASPGDCKSYIHQGNRFRLAYVTGGCDGVITPDHTSISVSTTMLPHVFRSKLKYDDATSQQWISEVMACVDDMNNGRNEYVAFVVPQPPPMPIE